MSHVPLLYALVTAWLVPDCLSETRDDASADDDRAQFGVSGKVAAIVTVFISVILLIALAELISGVISDYFNASDNVSTNFSNANFSDGTLNSIADPFGLLVGVLFIIAIVLKIIQFL